MEKQTEMHTQDENKVEIFSSEKQGLEIHGHWHVEMFDADTGEKIYDHEQDNIIVDAGVVKMAQGPGPASFSTIQLGDCNGATCNPLSVTDVQLFGTVVFTGPAVHTSLVGPRSFSYIKKATLAPTDAPNTTIREAGLFNGTTMLNHIAFNPPFSKGANVIANVSVTITLRRV